MKKILVTGGSGFIGTNLINFLNKKRFILTNLDKQSIVSTPEKFKNKNNNYKFHKINIKNIKKIRPILLGNYDIIIHLAAESHVDRSIDDPKSFFQENINSTLEFYNEITKLVKKGKINKPNIIHISTDEVYGSVKNGRSKENSKIFSSSPYSASKASSENIAQFYMETYSLNICILRITNNFGPFQFPEKFIPKIILRSFDKKKIPIYGNGKNIREWIYVEDTCKAIYLIIKNFKNKEIFNIGSNQRLQNNKVSKIIIDQLKYSKKNLIFVKDRPGHDLRYALDSEYFRKKFKWKNKYSFNTGIKKTILWYKNNKTWLKEIKKKYKDKRLGEL